MNKNKMKLIIAAIITAIGLVGCKSNDVEKNNETEERTIVSVADGGVNELEDIPESYPVINEISQYGDVKESQEYNFDTDYQYYARGNSDDMHYRAESEENIYITAVIFGPSGYSTKVYIIDKGTGIKREFCNKPQCTHTDLNCSGLFDGMKGMFYYNESLYALMEEKQFDMNNHYKGIIDLNLYKISLDGNIREKVGNIVSIVEGEQNVPTDFIIQYMVYYIQHRGYMYFVYSVGTGYDENTFYNNGSNSIYRVNLEEFNEKECIVNLERGGDLRNVNLMAEGSYVYYQLTDATSYRGIYRFNTESLVNENMGIKKSISERIYFSDKNLYYMKHEEGPKLYKYNSQTWEEQIFIDLGKEKTGYNYCTTPFFDGEYIYISAYNRPDSMWEELHWLVYDLEGKYITKIKNSEDGTIAPVYWGRSYILSFYEEGDDGTKLNIYSLDKSKINSGVETLFFELCK